VYRTAPWAKPVRVVLCPDATVSPPFAVINPVDENVPALVRLAPMAVREVTPWDESVTLPVEPEPKVKVCALVVPNTPIPERVVAIFPLFAEIDAVGVPLLTLMNANFEDTVAFDPRRRSCVIFLSIIAPLFSSKGEPPREIASCASELSVPSPPDVYTTPLVVKLPTLTTDPAFPIVVREEPETLMFVAPKTERPLFPVIKPEEVKVPALVKFAPIAVSDVIPCEDRTTFPVVEEPSVRVWEFVVPSVPSP
jgi:hypothetical protein